MLSSEVSIYDKTSFSFIYNWIKNEYKDTHIINAAMFCSIYIDKFNKSARI